MSLGLLIIRLVIGLTFAGHGTQKLFGWFGGPGLKGTAGWLDSMGMKPGFLAALLAGLGELVAGLLLALGLWLPVSAALFIITMVVAIITVHGKNGFWLTKSGIEYNVTLIGVALGVALIGPGAYAIHF
ncbi:DoxX family protein [Alicyclobacillus dauci]|uniref:DoxX family protein n=1 Tax=Alicyclobacillus dauci TaxID=1475485 RepID=A0ABY6Z622_9BACL|nr:DoxX family protein [Alicyclobacillus dauci]WAH38348.1 DoxX family protein [Alicyclobacillus dauci]